MPRFLDDLRAAGRFEKPWFIPPRLETDWRGYAARMWEYLINPELPVLLIDNVAEYYFAGTDQEFWSLDRDFPNLAPPYPAFWCEHKLPKLIRSTSGDTDTTKILTNGRAGLLILSTPPELVGFAEGVAPEGTRWVLLCDVWLDYNQRGHGTQGPHSPTFLFIDGEGRLLDKPFMQSFAGEEHAEMMKGVMGWFNPAFLAVSFLHCKNVTLENHIVPKPMAKRYRERHGGHSLTPYHTLVIEPLKAVLRREGKADSVGLKKAMHICRGHFSDYREGRGLFGKYKKLVWMPQTVRGTKGKSAPPREMEIKL